MIDIIKVAFEVHDITSTMYMFHCMFFVDLLDSVDTFMELRKLFYFHTVLILLILGVDDLITS